MRSPCIMNDRGLIFLAHERTADVHGKRVEGTPGVAGSPQGDHPRGHRPSFATLARPSRFLNHGPGEKTCHRHFTRTPRKWGRPEPDRVAGGGERGDDGERRGREGGKRGGGEA